MVKQKSAKKAGPSATKKAGGAGRSAAVARRAAPARAAAGKSAGRSGTRATAAKPARSKTAGSAAASMKTATARKPAAAKAIPRSAAPRKVPVAPHAARPSRPAAPGKAPAPPRDDAARQKVQLLEQEKARLQDLGNQMRAERDSVLAEAERLRARVQELESQHSQPAAAEPSAAGPGSFDAAVDLDEDLPAATDDDLEETAGFFDRMDEIRARRNELDRERNDRELEQSDQSFWMICPKCGDLMEESEGENVKLERCENCGGLYLDRGEVDLILSLCAGPDAYRRLHNILKF